MNKAMLYEHEDVLGNKINLLTVVLDLDDFEDCLISGAPYILTSQDDESLRIEISVYDLQAYMNFFASSIENDGAELPFYINFDTGRVYQPEEAYRKFMSELTDPETLLKFDTLIFAMEDGSKKEVGVMQMKFSFMNELLSPKKPIEFEDFPFITAEKLKSLYTDFLEKKISQKYFLLAIDIDEEKAIGYIIEPSIDCPIDKIRLVIPDN